MYPSIVFKKTIQSQVGFTLKLMHFEPNNFNNKEHYSFILMMTHKQSLQTWCKIG
jgi:hypothetical protein